MSTQPVTLSALSPAAEHGWHLLLDLPEAGFTDWVLIGGQMMHLLTVEHGGALPRPTDDMDVVVNVRSSPGGIGLIADWLVARGLEFEQPSSDGVGTRFSGPAAPGPGRVIFDVLAPEGLGERTDVRTRPPARTVAAPGATQAFERSSWVEVTVFSGVGRATRTGRIRRPTLLGALVLKAAATQILVRHNPERDWEDAAMALSLLPDPFADAQQLTKGDRRRLSLLRPLAGDHDAWLPLGRRGRQQGQDALAILLGDPAAVTRTRS